MTILLPLAAASLTAGCTTFSDADAVARVGETELSTEELDELVGDGGVEVVSDWRSRPRRRCPDPGGG